MAAGHPNATPTGNWQSLATSWNPFSWGLGKCIGQTLALAEARTTLAVFVTQFQFDLPKGVNQEFLMKTQQVLRLTESLQPKDRPLLKVRHLIIGES